MDETTHENTPAQNRLRLVFKATEIAKLLITHSEEEQRLVLDELGRVIAAHKTGTLRYLDWNGTKIKIAQCVYCRFWIPARLWTQDHVYPLRYKGARRAVANVVLACEACNNSKSTWLPCRKCESLRELRTADLISGSVLCLCTCNNVKRITVIPGLP